eukprot:13996762-Ditylum_brightwellii.AAC.1
MQFPPRSMWENAVKVIKDVLQMNRNQLSKIYRVFNCCEDARRQCKCYDGKHNLFVRTEKQVLRTEGIEGQIITDTLQGGGNFCGVAEVVNCWCMENNKNHVAVST